MPATRGGWTAIGFESKIIVLTVTALTLAAGFEVEGVPRRGPFAFHYGSSLSEESLAWYSQFDLLVTHDPLPRAQVARLHAAGTRLLLYEWSVAFYDARATQWQRSLLLHGKQNLLNATPLVGGVGSETSGAWYFDPASDEHEVRRAASLARRIKDIRYDGVFFDTTTVENVHPDARKEYERRHPDTPYDLAFSRFLRQLRKKLPKGILFTNQAYRSAPYYLPWIDWDLTESLVTRPHNGSSEIRPWNDLADPWNSIHFVLLNLIQPLAARFPKVPFGLLNYIDGSNPETIRLVTEAAQLFDAEGYVAAPSVLAEADAIYFRDPGKAVSARFDLAAGQAAYRFFEHGLIAVTAAPEEIRIRNVPPKGLRNRFTREVICGETITRPAAAGQPRAYFFDRTSDCRSR